MRLLFRPDATPVQRDAVREALRRIDVSFADAEDSLLLEEAPEPAEAAGIAALAGVASIGPSPAAAVTVRDSILTWTMGAATVLGALTILTASLPATLGEPADPLRTPSPLRPSWPLLAWYAAVDRSPSWVPVPFLFLVAALVLFFWSDIAQKLATKRPLVHTALGAAALLVAGGLAALELFR